MDKEARRNGIIGSGHGRKNIGLSNIDGGHIPSIDDIGTQKSDEDLVDHGKMSTWGKKTKEELIRIKTSFSNTFFQWQTIYIPHFLYSELVVLQAVLLTLLIFISLLWAFCCKKKCLSVSI